MLLLGWLTLIFLQDPINDPDERIQFRSCRWPAPPVSRRHRERQHLRDRPRVDAKPPRRLPPAHPPTYTARRTCPYSSTPFIPPPSAHLGRRPSAAGLLLRLGRSTRPLYEGFSLRRSQFWRLAEDARQQSARVCDRGLYSGAAQLRRAPRRLLRRPQAHVCRQGARRIHASI